MARTNYGKDWQSKALGGDTVPAAGASTSPTGTSTGVTATTLTHTGRTWTTDMWKGHIVATAGVYGVVISNTGTVLTIDKWYNPDDPGGTAASTPSTGSYVILPGNAMAWWMGLTETAGLDATRTALSGELTGEGLGRALCTWAHTTNTTSYTLTKTYTMSSGTSRTIQVAGVYQSANGSTMAFETSVPNPPTLVPNDQLQVTDTVSI